MHLGEKGAMPSTYCVPKLALQGPLPFPPSLPAARGVDHGLAMACALSPSLPLLDASELPICWGPCCGGSLIGGAWAAISGIQQLHTWHFASAGGLAPALQARQISASTL